MCEVRLNQNVLQKYMCENAKVKKMDKKMR